MADRNGAVLAAVLVELQQHTSELKQIRALLEALVEQQGTEAGTPPRVLRAIYDAVNGCAFSAAELIKHADVIDGHLRRALDAIGALKNARVLGHWLASIEDDDIDGLAVTRVTEDAAGVVWQVQPAGFAPETHGA